MNNMHISRADAQDKLFDAIILWIEHYRDNNCDEDEGFEKNKLKARKAFHELFGIEVLDAIRDGRFFYDRTRKEG